MSFAASALTWCVCGCGCVLLARAASVAVRVAVLSDRLLVSYAQHLSGMSKTGKNGWPWMTQVPLNSPRPCSILILAPPLHPCMVPTQGDCNFAAVPQQGQWTKLVSAVYVSTDVVALIMVNKLPTTTVVHHWVSALLVVCVCLCVCFGPSLILGPLTFELVGGCFCAQRMKAFAFPAYILLGGVSTSTRGCVCPALPHTILGAGTNSLPDTNGRPLSLICRSCIASTWTSA